MADPQLRLPPGADEHALVSITSNVATCSCGAQFHRPRHPQIREQHRHAHSSHRREARKGGAHDLRGDAWATCPLGCDAPRVFKRAYGCGTVVFGDPPNDIIIDRGRVCYGMKPSTREAMEARHHVG